MSARRQSLGVAGCAVVSVAAIIIAVAAVFVCPDHHLEPTFTGSSHVAGAAPSVLSAVCAATLFECPGAHLPARSLATPTRLAGVGVADSGLSARRTGAPRAGPPGIEIHLSVLRT